MPIDFNSTPPPSTPPSPAPPPDPPALDVLNETERKIAAYLLERVDWMAELIAHTTKQLNPADILILCSFLVGAMEDQDPVQGQAFVEMKEFFRQLNPKIMEAANVIKEPGNFHIIVPRVRRGSTKVQ